MLNYAVKIPCEVYSRVAGYYRPVQAFNVAKQHEFSQRKTYDKKLLEKVNAEHSSTDL